jgi:hypothetical protein
MTRHGQIAALLGIALLAACGEKKNPVEPLLGSAPGGRIKFFNFAMGSPNVNFYVDTTKLTGILSSADTASRSATAYGSAAAGGLYNSVPAGQHTFSGRISAATDFNLPISSTSLNIDPNKFYSYYLSGFYNTTTKQADSFLLEDNWTVPTDTMVSVRFVNASPNAGTLQLAVRTDSLSPDVNLGAAETYKGASDFVKIAPGVYDVSVSGTRAGVPFTFRRIGVSFVALHVYTVSLRGDWTVTSTTATNRPVLDVIANY